MRLAGASVILAVLAYVSVATTIFALVRYQREVHGARLVDVVVPFRWQRFRAAQGDHLIATAAHLAQRGQGREALSHARAGVAQSPTHRFGRLLLARLLLEANRPEAARQVLLDGLRHHSGDPRYLSPLLTYLLHRQEDAHVIALAEALLPPQPGPLPQHRLLAFAGATASFLRGRYDLAEDFLRRLPQLERSREGRLLSAKLDWQRGYRELALLGLRGLADAQPNDAEIHSELVARLRQAGYLDEARRRSISLLIAQPERAAPRLALLQLAATAPDALLLAREVDALLQDFSDTPTLLALAEFAANAGDGALAQRVCDRVKALGLPAQPHAILRIEALLVAHDYRAAREAIRSARESPDWPARYQPLFDSLQAVAFLGLGDRETSRIFLTSFLHQPALRSENLVALANRFVALEAGEWARQILSRAVALDPLNQAALNRLVELDLDLNRIDELPAHLNRLLTLRQPPPDLLRVAQHKLGSDLFLYSAERAATLDAVRLALDSTRAPRRD